MSNSTALAAVTATLRFILQQGITTDNNQPELNHTKVTTLPPDKARTGVTGNQLNLFLYQVLPNAAWRNRDMPRQVQPGETGMPPLPLNLYYLITAFGLDDDPTQLLSHQVLGKAMSLLHDHSVLSASDIQSATSGALSDCDLDKQIERVRITLQPLSVEDISKLWTGFATQYRLSAAYEVAVALIESTQASRTPLPVLTRGDKDTGVSALPSLIPPYPALDNIVFDNKQTSARLGERLLLNGHHLDGSNLDVQFDHPLWPNPDEITPETSNPTPTALQVVVKIPIVPASWPAGFYTVAVLVQRPNETYRRVTNQLSFPLAPSISIAPTSAPPGDITFTVTVSPDVLPEQRAALLLGDREILADDHKTQTGTLTFQAASVAAGEYYVRLRVDGVDSILVDRTQQPPIFDKDKTQKVSVK